MRAPALPAVDATVDEPHPGGGVGNIADAAAEAVVGVEAAMPAAAAIPSPSVAIVERLMVDGSEAVVGPLLDGLSFFLAFGL